MFSLFNHLKKANEDQIKSQYEYLILFIHTFILDEFQLEVRKEFFFWIKDCFFSFQETG
jgi:hypothetical protein